MVSGISIPTLSIKITKGDLEFGKFNINKEGLYNLGSKVVKIIIIFVFMYLAIKIGNAIIKRYVSRQKDFKFSLDEKKAKTIGAILKSVLKYSVYFIGLMGIIETLFGGIGITFAGIGGVAVGLGAQSLIKDIINGFFILFENQFNVGDYITIDDKSGIVDSIELRVTKIRDFNGDTYILPNGLITKITNHSRGSSRIQVSLDVPCEEDLDRIIDLISDLCNRFKIENECVIDGPSVLGISDIKDGNITIKVAGKVKPMTQWDTEMKLRKEIFNELNKANIKRPCSTIKIIKEGD
ncbi:mechanosensitive ion channel family protein [Clostridium fermenticellae]|uniref:Mechanosensitive ion channel family protein n=1 Tax=Clostridium fermenticellae TaxID=2068654 RepID=A0A386H7F8_9CLOT|nr:mechanosensitive ion channel domain-containing protein [Clostridium fermenticellae]AYD41495.1 mechanosensitive ion channel family protein [Clostridium fermenticellae]